MSARIRTENLLVADDNSSADELIYTLVIIPSYGDLSLNGEILSIGDQFTQAQLSNGEIRYFHESGEETIDNFVFTVIDGEGGWLDLTEFSILVGDDIISSNEEILNDNSFEVYPNPSSDIVWIQSRDNAYEWNVELFDIQGRMLLKERMQSSSAISVAEFEDGIYILKISNKNSSKTYRIQVIH